MADILQITLPDGTTYDLKDSTAVTNVGWDSTNWKIQKTINGTTSDVVTLPLISGTGTDSAVGGKKTGATACVASGNYSFAFGSGAQATNTCAVAFNTISSGQASFSVGYKIAGENNTEASGVGAIAMGGSTFASGNYSTSIGYNCTASGVMSIAIGTQNSATAQYAISIGRATKASSQYQTALGKFNIEDNQDTYAFIIGNGTGDNTRSNAMTVDWNGNIGANNIVTSTSVSNTGLISFLNSNSTAVYTTQLPTYDGSVTGGSSGSNRYVVTITYDENEDEYSADKTFAQVYAACEAGKVVQAYIDDYGTYYSLNFYNDGAIAFGFLDAETVYLYEFVINDDETVSVYDIQLQTV